MFTIKSLEEAGDMIMGATVLGTGGGGSPAEGFSMLRELIERGLEITIVDIDELPEDSIIVSPYYVGTIAPTAKIRKPVRITNSIGEAFKIMSRVLGKRVSAAVATELGGGNTAVAIRIAAELGIPVVDGDLLGRAAPELHQNTVHIFNLPMYPSVLVTPTGNIVIVEKYADVDDYESMARHLSILSGRFVAVVDTPLTVSDAKKAVVRGTISLCLKVGRAVREARAVGRDPVKAIVDSLGGWKIFEGTVEEYSWRDEGGFLVGETRVRGSGRLGGRVLRTWIKNEHLMAWIDGEPIVMAPDLIIFTRDDGEPITNTVLKIGDRIHVIAAKAPDVWRSPKGLDLFGPRHFGFDYSYVPVEELVKRFGL
ncbi:MAG: DUF917 domain-containing protein [Ignisphaera sp.]|nr:DUF917 domain-containing protein [Ignisphaera sp.]MDW8084820.1 DUF917 domain-containing protein [Ignisphaera sp.]